MRTLLVVLMFASLAVGGCVGSSSCTLIGCLDGVTVNWSGASSTDRGTLTADGVAIAFDCAAPSGSTVLCTGTGVRLQGRPASLRVEVMTRAGARTASFTPQYVQSRPNGPGCDPVCNSATVTVP
ncbi:MAG: hypothetical protein U0324_47095 [Polyangiales bacterium]